MDRDPQTIHQCADAPLTRPEPRCTEVGVAARNRLRHHPTANAFAGFEHRDAQAGSGETVSYGKPTDPATDDHDIELGHRAPAVTVNGLG